MRKYIDKDEVVAEINRVLNSYDPNEIINAIYALADLRKFLDTLEVKEMDLDNEYIEEVYSHLDSIKDTADRMTSGNFMHHRTAIKLSANIIANVLELIGIKAQKGE